VAQPATGKAANLFQQILVSAGHASASNPQPRAHHGTHGDVSTQQGLDSPDGLPPGRHDCSVAQQLCHRHNTHPAATARTPSTGTPPPHTHTECRAACGVSGHSRRWQLSECLQQISRSTPLPVPRETYPTEQGMQQPTTNLVPKHGQHTDGNRISRVCGNTTQQVLSAISNSTHRGFCLCEAGRRFVGAIGQPPQQQQTPSQSRQLNITRTCHVWCHWNRCCCSCWRH
jgi:hypothetical protein